MGMMEEYKVPCTVVRAAGGRVPHRLSGALLLLLLAAGCAENGQTLSPGVAQGLGGALRAVGTRGTGGLAMAAGLNGLLRSLTAEQQRQRQDALQAAARAPVGRSVSWSSDGGEAAGRADRGGGRQQAAARQQTRATYVNKGSATNDKGQKCSKVEETITLPDGKTGTSEQLVCPA